MLWVYKVCLTWVSWSRFASVSSRALPLHKTPAFLKNRHLTKMGAVPSSLMRSFTYAYPLHTKSVDPCRSPSWIWYSMGPDYGQVKGPQHFRMLLLSLSLPKCMYVGTTHSRRRRRRCTYTWSSSIMSSCTYYSTYAYQSHIDPDKIQIVAYQIHIRETYGCA